MLALLLTPLLPLLALAVIVGLRYPMWLLAVYAAIVPWGSGYAVPLGLPPAFSSLSTLVGVAASVGIVAHLLSSRRRAQVLLPAIGLFALLLGWVALTVLWSVAPARSLEEVLALLSLIGLFAVAGLVATDERGIEIFERGIVLGGVVAGLAALVQLLTGTLADELGNPRFELAGGGGEGGDPNTTAAILLLPFVVAMARALRPQTDRLMRPVWLAGAGLVSLGIALTASRGGLLCAVVALSVLGWTSRLRWRMVAGVAAVLVGLALVAFLGPGALEERFTESTGSTGRADVWRIGLVACEQRCVTGAGWGAFGVVHEEILLREPSATGHRFRFEPHNAWLGTAVEGGIPALLLLVAGIGSLAGSLRELPRERRGPPLAALAALVVTNTFLSNHDFKYFWLVLTYAAVVATSQRRQPRRAAVVVSDDGVRDDVTPRPFERVP